MEEKVFLPSVLHRNGKTRGESQQDSMFTQVTNFYCEYVNMDLQINDMVA